MYWENERADYKDKGVTRENNYKADGKKGSESESNKEICYKAIKSYMECQIYK